MANYSLILDAKFKPFSYQEMVTPVLEATKAHQALEDMYGELSYKANIWEEMANEQTDPYAYSLYKKYADDLTARADQLMQYGLNPASRRDMLDMRSRYSKEILPIENAYNRREKLAEEQRQALLSNPTMFFQRDAATTSLDDFIRNPSLDYGASYSGALLTQQASQMAAALQNALTSRSGLKGIGLPYQYEELLQYGYTPEDIQLAITDPKNPKAQPVLNTIIDQVMTASGMNTWASDAQKKAARAYAAEGLYSAIGKPEIKNFVDNYSMELALEREKARIAAEAARKAQEEALDNIDTKQLALNPTPIYKQNNLDDSYDYSEYFDQTTGHLNKLGHDALLFGRFVATSNRYGVGPEGINYKKASSDYLGEFNAQGRTGGDRYKLRFPDKLDPDKARSFYSHIALSGAFKNRGKDKKGLKWDSIPVGTYFGPSQAKTFGDIAARLGLNKALYDATARTEFGYQVDNADQDNLRTIVTSRLPEEVPEIYMGEDKFVNGDRTVSRKDLMDKDKYTIRELKLSPYGNSVIYIDENGEEVRVALPIINPTAQTSMEKSIARAKEFSRLKAEAEKAGKRDAAQYYDKKYAIEIQSAYTYMSQLGLTNRTKSQEFNPIPQ